ncbi:MAG TPA: hypothetical protein PJ998_11140 [Terrimesophilobacter sp.]|nr:hypothetical protein [Terrimesophilobacter sp.]
MILKTLSCRDFKMVTSRKLLIIRWRYGPIAGFAHAKGHGLLDYVALLNGKRRRFESTIPIHSEPWEPMVSETIDDVLVSRIESIEV